MSQKLASALLEGADFPLTVWVTNTTPMPLSEGNLPVFVPPYKTVAVEVKSLDALKRAEGNMVHLAKVRHWNDPAYTVSITDPAAPQKVEAVVPEPVQAAAAQEPAPAADEPAAKPAKATKKGSA